MRRAPVGPVLALLLFVAACGGGGGGGGGPVAPGGPSLTFTAAGAGSNSVALARDAASTSSTLFLEVVATDLSDLYGVAFDLLYPSDLLSFEGVVEEDFLSQQGAFGTSLQLAENPTGNLIVGLSRLGAVGGRSGSGSLMTLEFRAVAAGSGPFGFDRASALDPQGEEIPGVTFAAGTVQVRL